MDVKSAYLYPGNMEEIYLEQPSNFENLHPSGKNSFAE